MNHYLLLIFLIYITNLCAGLQNDATITWKNPPSSVSDEFQKKLPLDVNSTSSELTPLNGKKRFEVSITYKLNQADPLYKRGERFVLGHTNMAGSVTQGDSIEFANLDHAIIDINNQLVTFTFRFTKGLTDVNHNFVFSGGRLLADESKEPLTKYTSGSFRTDGSLLCFITMRFLSDNEASKMNVCPILQKTYKPNLNNPDITDYNPKDRQLYLIFQGETFTFNKLNLPGLMGIDGHGIEAGTASIDDGGFGSTISSTNWEVNGVADPLITVHISTSVPESSLPVISFQTHHDDDTGNYTTGYIFLRIITYYEYHGIARYVDPEDGTTLHPIIGKVGVLKFHAESPWSTTPIPNSLEEFPIDPVDGSFTAIIRSPIYRIMCSAENSNFLIIKCNRSTPPQYQCNASGYQTGWQYLNTNYQQLDEQMEYEFDFDDIHRFTYTNCLIPDQEDVTVDLQYPEEKSYFISSTDYCLAQQVLSQANRFKNQFTHWGSSFGTSEPNRLYIVSHYHCPYPSCMALTHFSPNQSTYGLTGRPTILINGIDLPGAYDVDEKDNSVILHEMGHAYQYYNGYDSLIPGPTPAGTHYWFDDITAPQGTPELAFHEGVANFMSGLVRKNTPRNLYDQAGGLPNPPHNNYRYYDDTHDSGSYCLWMNYETGIYCQEADPGLHAPYNAIPYTSTYDAATTCIIWDLLDAYSDAESWDTINLSASNVLDPIFRTGTLGLTAPSNLDEYIANMKTMAPTYGITSAQIQAIYDHYMTMQTIPPLYIVSADGNGDFLSISEALSSILVTEGTKLFINPGTYEEDIVLDKNITIEGTSSEKPFIKGGFSIQNWKDVKLKNLSIHSTLGTGILVNQGQLTLDSCDVYGNTIDGVLCNKPSTYNITHCKIFDNGVGVRIDNDVSNSNNYLDKLSYTLIYGNTQGILSDNITNITNCTIADNQVGISLLNLKIIQNTILYNNLNNWNSGSPLQITYSLVGGYTGPGIGNLNGNPVFVNEAQHNYNLRWDADVKSPCIDAGDPNTYSPIHYLDLPFTMDNDNSRFDIGAMFPEVAGHRNGIVKLEKKELINWFSIPAIDFTNSPRCSDHVNYVFNTFKNNNLFNTEFLTRLLEQLSWKYNGEDGFITYNVPNNCYSLPVPTHLVRSQYGYKIKLRADEGNFVCPETKNIEFDGIQPGNQGNPDSFLQLKHIDQNEIDCQPNPTTGLYERDVWLGYFLDKSMDPFIALAPVLDYIVSIKAQDWCLSRELIPSSKGLRNSLTYSPDSWLGAVEMGEKVAINPHEMVSVKYLGKSVSALSGTENTDMTFYWGGTNQSATRDKYQREKPQHFEYEEKIDYLPIYATIDFSSFEIGKIPTEIAIYVDGICKGAEKITSEEVQLKAYVNGETSFDGQTVEIKFWSPGKSNLETVANCQIWDESSSSYIYAPVTFQKNGNYIKVLVKNGGSTPSIPNVTALLGNYPNPFNPETIIRFSLVKQAAVKLEIFNIKGQKVKTLVNETKISGFYDVKWNGLDNSGKTVASGVYFYRLTTDKYSLTKKMLMLK